jgi:hypothetical protein
MDMISVIVWLSLAAVPLAVLSGWLAGAGNLPLAPLVLGRDAWRRSATAWPHGVQEDNEVTWRFVKANRPGAEAGDRYDPPCDSPYDSLSDPPSVDQSLERVRPTLSVRAR